MTNERKNFLYLTIINDYLKVNGYRIASHSAQKTPTPLSSRADIQPLLPLVKDGTLDILGLDNQSKITFCKTFYHDDLQAHNYNDSHFVNAMNAVLNIDNLNDIHFVFITNGIILPELLMKKEWDTLFGDYSNKIGKVEFFETRIKIDMLSKLSDQKIYLKNIISKMKRIHTDFKSSDVVFEGESCLEGSYDILYHNKIQTYPYWITQTGVQLEAPDSGGRIDEFVSGFK